MLDALLRPFQPDAHRHILVEDPDGLLDDETARAALLGRCLLYTSPSPRD